MRLFAPVMSAPMLKILPTPGALASEPMVSVWPLRLTPPAVAVGLPLPMSVTAERLGICSFWFQLMVAREPGSLAFWVLRMVGPW